MVIKVKLIGNFGNIQIGVNQQALDFKQLLCFDDLGGSLACQQFYRLCQVIGRNANHASITAQRNVFLAIFFNQLKKPFNQHLPFSFVQQTLVYRIARSAGNQDQIEYGTQHISGKITRLFGFRNTLPEQSFQKANITLIFK